MIQKTVLNNFADRNEVQCLLIFILFSMKEIAQETMKGGMTETGRDWTGKAKTQIQKVAF